MRIPDKMCVAVHAVAHMLKKDRIAQVDPLAFRVNSEHGQDAKPAVLKGVGIQCDAPLLATSLRDFRLPVHVKG